MYCTLPSQYANLLKFYIRTISVLYYQFKANVSDGKYSVVFYSDLCSTIINRAIEVRFTALLT